MPMAADAEATLPSLIEAVKAAIHRRSQGGHRQTRRGGEEGLCTESKRAHSGSAAPSAWDASPISTARLAMEIWAQIKDLDWSLVSLIRHRQRLAEPAVDDGEALSMARRLGRLGRRLRRARIGRRRARQSRSRPLLGQYPGATAT